MALIKLLIVLYLLSVLAAALYFLILAFFGVIEKPDESDKAWMEERRRHPFRLFFLVLELAFCWPYWFMWLVRKYGLFVDPEDKP